VCRIHAQDIYELTFTSEEVKYKGLLVIFNESNMYMRVAYNAEGMYKVVNVDYTSEHGEYDGVEYLVLIGSNPQFITESGQYGYNPDHLIFTDISDVPMILFDLQNSDSGFMADSFRSLEAGKVTDTYLRQFYRSNESDYLALRKLFGLDNSPVVSKNYESPVTLHLVVIANTAISDIGSGCSVDQRNLESEFRGISDALGILFKPHIVSGENFTKTNVLNTLNSQLSVGKNDIVVCVYRGHGFRWSNQTDIWPQLDIRTSSYVRLTENTTISLSDVYTTIVAKGARLNIVLGDCCNNDIGLSQVTSNNFLVMQNNNNYNLSKLKELFINSQGNLLSCAASPGEYSWVSSANGGFFTVSFLQALREEISYLKNDNADWNDILNNTIRSARSKTASCSNCTPQNGKLYFGITPK
ncbi:MAG: caspase family protein, partial [Bacteroidetes bacterium]